MFCICTVLDELTGSAVTQSAQAGSSQSGFAGYGLCALEILIVLFFIVKAVQASDAEMRAVKARSERRTAFVPKPGAFENVTTVASNTVSDKDVNYTPFTGRTDYENETVTVYDIPRDGVYTPFTEKAKYDAPDNGTVFDPPKEKCPYVGIVGADEPAKYGEEARHVTDVEPIVPDRTGQELWQTDEAQTETDDIFTPIGEGQGVPVIEADDNLTTTAPSIFDVLSGKKNKKE